MLCNTLQATLAILRSAWFPIAVRASSEQADFMENQVPPEISSKKYLDLASFRKNGVVVHTPLWFAERDGRLYVMTRSDSGKYKRIRNNPQVRVAPCTMRGKIVGPEFPARARVLPADEWPSTRKLLERKYWLMRIPFLWSKKNVFLQIEIEAQAAR